MKKLPKDVSRISVGIDELEKIKAHVPNVPHIDTKKIFIPKLGKR